RRQCRRAGAGFDARRGRPVGACDPPAHRAGQYGAAAHHAQRGAHAGRRRTLIHNTGRMPARGGTAMRKHLILLQGWGLGSAPLAPLAETLRVLDPMLRVDIEPLPERASGDPRDWLQELDERLPPQTWLGGWSLGGMLASELAAL